jgi:drug/metabolite transporter (DMT)-like permease
MAPVPVPAKDAPPTGNAIFVMAVLVVVVSSGLALVMAHLFRSGYPYQCSVLAVQQMVCTAFGAFMMGQRPEEAAKLRISRWNYLTMLLPFSGVLSLKLFLQNKAVQYVSPAFYAMTGSLLPVGVTMLSIAIGSAKFKWSTVAAAAVVSVGGVLIKFGQVELSTIGFVLTISSLGLDVVRLLLMQALLQPLRLSGMATMLLSAPQQCLLFFVNAAWADAREVAHRIKLGADEGGFGDDFYVILCVVCALAIMVVLFNLIFVKMTSAIISAICTPFKDLSTIVFSDLLVDKRTETPQAIIGFAMSCSASLAYNIHDVYEKRREAEARAAEDEAKPLLEAETGAASAKTGGSCQPELEEREDDWRVEDAYWVGLYCCVAGVIIYAYAVVWHLK